MNQVFPFGFPLPTAFYLTLCVATFALHQAFMHYVLAGSLYVAWTVLLPGRDEMPRRLQPLAARLRDWMPFMLSAAITAGVAPLLFVQIVYPRLFYTANVLLSWRWMMVIPVLIVAFYLLYVIKSHWLERIPRWARIGAAVVTAVCFVFVGFCWTANYLVAQNEAAWPEMFATGRLPFSAIDVLPRMAVWLGGSFLSLATIAAWQLHVTGGDLASGEVTREYRRLAAMSLGGLALAVVAGGGYLVAMPRDVQQALFGPLALPYLVLLGLAVSASAIGWMRRLRAGAPSRMGLAGMTAAWVLVLLSVSVLREAVRLAGIDLEPLMAEHAAAARIGGLGVFLLFAVVNAALIFLCIRLLRRGWQEPSG